MRHVRGRAAEKRSITGGHGRRRVEEILLQIGLVDLNSERRRRLLHLSPAPRGDDIAQQQPEMHRA